MHKLVAATAAAAGLFLVGAAPAWAHVTISPSSVPAGAQQTVLIQVPNEIDGQRTVRVELDFPPGEPLSGTEAPAVAGWAVSERSAGGAISQVVWTATPGGGIGTDQEVDFPLLIRAPSTPGLLVFKALQTYDDGTIVRWIEPPNPDGSPAPRPYPTLLVTSPGGAVPTPTTTAPPPAPSHHSATGVLALAVVGAAALIGLGVVARRSQVGHRSGRDVR